MVLHWKVFDESVVSLTMLPESCGDRCALATGKRPGTTTVDVSGVVGTLTLIGSDVVTVTQQ